MANGSASVISVAFALMLAALPVKAQTDFPKRPIHVVLPYPAGGIVDIATRIVTDKLSGLWRQPFVVEAKPAGSGNVAWDQVSRAAPDGYKTEGEDRNNGGENRPHVVTVRPARENHQLFSALWRFEQGQPLH